MFKNFLDRAAYPFGSTAAIVLTEQAASLAEFLSQLFFLLFDGIHLFVVGLILQVGRMFRFFTCLILAGLLQVSLAQEKAADAKYESLDIRRSLFPAEKLQMADAVRDDFSRNCAILAANKVAIEGRTEESLSQARKLLSLALQLNPRAKKAVVVNFQLERGVKPNREEVNYSNEVFAGLLHSVAKRLVEAGGKENVTMAAAFFNLAVDLDPKNEEIIYSQQLHEIDHGEFDWNSLEEQAPIK